MQNQILRYYFFDNLKNLSRNTPLFKSYYDCYKIVLSSLKALLRKLNSLPTQIYPTHDLGTYLFDEFKKSKDPYVFQFRNGKLDGPMQPKDI